MACKTCENLEEYQKPNPTSLIIILNEIISDVDPKQVRKLYIFPSLMKRTSAINHINVLVSIQNAIYTIIYEASIFLWLKLFIKT